MLRSVLLGLIVALGVLFADQYTKWLAIDFLFRDAYTIGTFKDWLFNATELYQPTYVKITSYLNIVMVWNFGVSFGVLNVGEATFANILITLSLGICFILLIWLWRTYALMNSLLIGAIIGGALGNVWDRVRFGGVIDFVDVHLGKYHWPAFNLADAAISISVILLILTQIFGTNDDETNT